MTFIINFEDKEIMLIQDTSFKDIIALQSYLPNWEEFTFIIVEDIILFDDHETEIERYSEE